MPDVGRGGGGGLPTLGYATMQTRDRGRPTLLSEWTFWRHFRGARPRQAIRSLEASTRRHERHTRYGQAVLQPQPFLSNVKRFVELSTECTISVFWSYFFLVYPAPPPQAPFPKAFFWLVHRLVFKKWPLIALIDRRIAVKPWWPSTPFAERFV